MDGEDEVLEVGPRRHRSRVTRVAVVLVVAAAVVGYLALGRGDEPPRRTAAPTPSAPISSVAAGLPPWPQRAGACGSTAFLPLVTAQRLDQHTGIRGLVGDRLSTVDIDTGAVTSTAGIPRGMYATQVVTADNRTYALLADCDQAVSSTATVVRLASSGATQVVARGPYVQLIGGGTHPWGVISTANGATLLDPLDGSPRTTLAPDVTVVGAHAGLLVGTVSQSDETTVAIQLLDAATGKVTLLLASASAVTVSRGVIVWTGPGCSVCRIYTYDLATGARTQSLHPVPSGDFLWSGVVSPDHRTVVFPRQRSEPSTYDMSHPGNPNELVTVELGSGAVAPVPGLLLWPKSFPGLDFSADSRWLVVGLDEGTGVRLLVWRPGLSHPLESPARLTSAVAFAPAVTTT